MAIRLKCPECQKPLKVADELSGRRIRCPGCQKILTVSPPAGSPQAGDMRDRGKARSAEGEIPDDWLGGGNVIATSGSSPAAEDELPSLLPETPPPRVAGRPRSRDPSEGSFVPTRGADDELPAGGRTARTVAR